MNASLTPRITAGALAALAARSTRAVRNALTLRSALTTSAALGVLTASALTACAPAPITPSAPGASTVQFADGKAGADSPAFLGIDGIDTAAPTEPGMPLPTGSTRFPASSISSTGDDSADRVTTLPPTGMPPATLVPAITKRGRLVIGIDQSQNRLSYRDQSTGELRGFEVELGREIARDIFGDPDAADFRFIDSTNLPSMLNDGTVDIIIRALTITNIRAQQASFSAPYLTASKRLLVPSDSTLTSPDDLNGQRVCVARGSTALDKLGLVAPDSEVLAVRRWSDCLQALQQRHIDAIYGDDAILLGISDQDPFTRIVGADGGGTATKEHYGVMMRKAIDADSQGLVRQVNSTIARILADGTWDSMFHRWFGSDLVYQRPPAPMYAEASSTTPSTHSDTATSTTSSTAPSAPSSTTTTEVGGIDE